MSDYEIPSDDSLRRISGQDLLDSEPDQPSGSSAPPDVSPRAQRFYDRTRTRIASYITKKGGKNGKASELLFFVPDVFILLWRLVNDSRVTGKNKLLLGTGIVYFIFPLDLVPEALLGAIGYLDDLVFAVYILNKLLRDTDEAVLREHWSGDTDLLEMMRKVLHSADQLVGKDVLNQIKKLVK
ncbi:MAG TPA: DUF1232 domain-containing protein [Thermoanaerobaculia bacterium]|nr:DUF1232 domain-containing protein [Thermoanaerobaculia bacterium]